MLLFSHSVVSNSLQPHRLQHAKLPWPSLRPRVCSNSCLLSQWCHPNTEVSCLLTGYSQIQYLVLITLLYSLQTVKTGQSPVLKNTLKATELSSYNRYFLPHLKETVLPIHLNPSSDRAFHNFLKNSFFYCSEIDSLKPLYTYFIWSLGSMKNECYILSTWQHFKCQN